MLFLQDFSNEELDKWTPPDWIIQNYRFYMTGFDDEHRPSNVFLLVAKHAALIFWQVFC